MKNHRDYEDKGQYWLDRMANEKPSWFKITKDMIKSFISGNTIDLDGLNVKIQRTEPKHSIDKALSKYSNYKYGGFYVLDKPEYSSSGKYLPRYIELTGKEIEALYKLHKANKEVK